MQKNKVIFTVILVLFMMVSCSNEKQIGNKKTEYENIFIDEVEVTKKPEGITWNDNQVLPIFAYPEQVLDAINITEKTSSIKTTLVSLQGIVNKKKPRIMLYNEQSDKDEKWIKENGLQYKFLNHNDALLKYKNEISGIVIYDTKLRDTINLANTFAGLNNAIVCSIEEAGKYISEPYNFSVLANYNDMFENKYQVYEFLYDNLWKDCTKKLIVGVNTDKKEGHLTNIRDVAIATGAAVIWLDPNDVFESSILDKFFKDCIPGETIYMGWWADEGAGILAGSEYGIPVVPSDFYENYSIYSGVSRELDIPEIPAKPILENKFYIAMVIGEGDNLQYIQHAMKTSNKLWSNKKRGEYPLNWTFSLALYDAGPQILNYYYKTATENDCIISGPSGIGYTDPIRWNSQYTNIDDFIKYVKKTDLYIRRTGMKSITIWNYISNEQASVFTNYCPALYGFTLQERFAVQELQYIVDGKMPLLTTYPRYDGELKRVRDIIENEINKWDGESPQFMIPQFESWSISIEDVYRIASYLEKKYDNIEFVRMDHLMMLFSETNNAPYNIVLRSKNIISSGYDEEYYVENAFNGSFAKEKRWQCSEDDKWLIIDLEDTYNITRYCIINAGAGYLPIDYNTVTFKIEISIDNKNWITTDFVEGNRSNIVDKYIEKTKARYIKLHIVDAGSDNIARIQEFEIYGYKDNQ